MSSKKDIAVSVRGLSKAYTIAHEQEKQSTLAETLLQRARRPFSRAKKETFWALRDVSFDIRKGEVVGIIGRNGAGKSTLLKILSRITEPTSGKIDLYGRVGSLLEVGTGFHPELTGRENIFLNGAILGMRKAEISRQFDAIVDFSGCEMFLDTPVKRYSSGMYVRLAFAVAAHLNSEILIVDEVLAIGDAEFQKRCLGKMKDVAAGGRTVLLVSHSMASVKHLCDSALVLSRGKLAFSGSVDECITFYTNGELVERGTILSHAQNVSAGVSLKCLEVNGCSNDSVALNNGKNQLDIIVSGYLSESIRMDLEIILTDTSDTALGFYSRGHETGTSKLIEAGNFTLHRKVLLPRRMNKGEYVLSFNLTEHNIKIWAHLPQCLRIVVGGAATQTGKTINYNDGVGWLLLEDASLTS